MKIVVCLRQSVNGEINPFDASAYEAALQIPEGDVTLLSMAAQRSAGFLSDLSRLGAKQAILLSDPAFAGADTLATAYTLSLAIKKLKPDLILCGRQTVDGDTGQVGPELATLANYNLVTNVMQLWVNEDGVGCRDRDDKIWETPLPALLTLERIHTLRLPSLRSKKCDVQIWSAAELEADLSRCGLKGSPTRVLKTFESEQDRRKCVFITPEELSAAIAAGLEKGKNRMTPTESSKEKLPNVCIVGNGPREMAETVGDTITEIPLNSAEKISEWIKTNRPEVLLWGSDRESKKIAAQVAAMLRLGLCADCTHLETDGTELYMYRPAFSKSIIAKIRSMTRPQMATVRTTQPDTSPVVVGIGAGCKGCIEAAKKFAQDMGADIAASRVMVDGDYFPYELQTGLTGKTIHPDVYIALGISGAVHHIAGISGAGTIIAINSDRNAPIFEYADVGIVCDVNEILTQKNAAQQGI